MQLKVYRLQYNLKVLFGLVFNAGFTDNTEHMKMMSNLSKKKTWKGVVSS